MLAEAESRLTLDFGADIRSGKRVKPKIVLTPKFGAEAYRFTKLSTPKFGAETGRLSECGRGGSMDVRTEAEKQVVKIAVYLPPTREFPGVFHNFVGFPMHELLKPKPHNLRLKARKCRIHQNSIQNRQHRSSGALMKRTAVGLW